MYYTHYVGQIQQQNDVIVNIDIYIYTYILVTYLNDKLIKFSL